MGIYYCSYCDDLKDDDTSPCEEDSNGDLICEECQTRLQSEDWRDERTWFQVCMGKRNVTKPIATKPIAEDAQ